MADPSTSGVQLDGNGIRVERDLLNSCIIALFLESMLFGVFSVVYSMGTWAILRGDQPRAFRKRNGLLLGASTLMFLLSLAHLALTIQMTLYGFVTKGNDRESVYDALFDYTSIFGSPVATAAYFLYVTQTLIGDAFMVYRLFVVWNGKRAIIVAPIILFVIDAVGGYGLSLLGIAGPIVFFSFSFFTNTLSSILIMTRLLRANGQTQNHWEWHSRALFNLVRYRRVVEAIVQSAAIYSTASISLVVTIFISPNIGFYSCISVFPPLIGTVFSLIVLHVVRNSATSTTPSNRTNSEWQESHASVPRKVPWTASQSESMLHIRLESAQSSDRTLLPT